MLLIRPISHLTVLTALLLAAVGASEEISLVKTSFKLTYVQDGEKMHRVWLTADPETVTKPGSEEGFSVEEGDALAVQASFVDEKEEPCSIHQSFLRFKNQRTGEDNIFLMKRKGRDMKVDINLRLEIKSDADFWTTDDTYSVELIMGDLKLHKSVAWIITEKMRFAESAKSMFDRPERGVFDFDVGVKKNLLPEFISPIPAPEKRAPTPMVIAALVGVLLPFPLLFVGWSQLGVFPLQFPKDKGRRAAIFGFEVCLLAHLAALTLFWVKWNIVTTWKVMGALMIPTLLFGRTVLSPSEEKR